MPGSTLKNGKARLTSSLEDRLQHSRQVMNLRSGPASPSVIRPRSYGGAFGLRYSLVGARRPITGTEDLVMSDWWAITVTITAAMLIGKALSWLQTLLGLG